MPSNIDRYIEDVIRNRKLLSEVESKINQHKQDIPAKIWQEFTDISHWLEQSEKKIRQICQSYVGDINHAREEIISLLNQFHESREKLRQVENLFLEFIIRPGIRLKQAVRQREYLESEFSRIEHAILNGSFNDQTELETEIRRVLSHGEAAFETKDENIEEEINLEEKLIDLYFETDAEDVSEAISKEELIRDFKRFVLPKIHPDTSETSAEDFKTVFEVYQQGDFLLMEAYITEYRGELQSEPDLDPLENLEQLKETENGYQRLLGKLQRRVERLKQDLLEHGGEEPEKIVMKMENQRKDILSRILKEAEKILFWRSKIEDLIQVYKDRFPNLEGE
ncbi:MAG: hypothetical protein IH585_07045 [Anaerolineaceae bacterium]|nr:hypothetical protein [Anaerolineaceae bacterium]